jgi:hypothetical protein
LPVGALFPSAARYHRYDGCHCFKDSWASISVDNIIRKVRDYVLYGVEEPSRPISGKESCASIECLCPNFPEDVKRAKIKMLSFTLEPASNKLSEIDANNLCFITSLSRYLASYGIRAECSE